MSEEITLAGNTVTVDVARDQEKRYIGLSEKQDLGPDEGMLFVWPTEKEHGLVMRDMNFGLDMVFADASGTVTKVASCDPDGEGATAFSKYAVELPRGWCKKVGVEEGDGLDLDGVGFGKSDTLTESLVENIAKQAAEAVGDGSDDVWVPYVGPKGGEGWQHASTGEVRYQQDPPGEVHPDYSDDYWQQHDAGGEEEGRPGAGEEERPVPDTGTEQREEGYFVSAPPNPDEDIPSFKEDESVTKSIEQTNEEPMEGFTVQRNLDSYDMWSDDVWFVGLNSVEFDADRGITKEDVTNFYEEQLPALESSPALRIGGYHFDDGTKISIDISVALTDEEEAEELGTEMNQESIFNPKLAAETDFAEGSIMTNPDADSHESPLDSPEEIIETLSKLDSLAKSLVGRMLRSILDKQLNGDQPMTDSTELDMDARFESEDGRVVTRSQIFRRGWKESADVESTEEGYLVDGELYRSVD